MHAWTGELLLAGRAELLRVVPYGREARTRELQMGQWNGVRGVVEGQQATRRGAFAVSKWYGKRGSMGAGQTSELVGDD